jgi:hypothetical protein
VAVPLAGGGDGAGVTVDVDGGVLHWMVDPFAGAPFAGAGVEGAGAPGAFHWIVEPESGVGDVKTGKSSAIANDVPITNKAEAIKEIKARE